MEDEYYIYASQLAAAAASCLDGRFEDGWGYQEPPEGVEANPGNWMGQAWHMGKFAESCAQWVENSAIFGQN